MSQERIDSMKDEAQAFLNRMAAHYNAADPTAIAAMFLPDALLLSPYAPPCRARAAIEALHEVWAAEPGGSKSFRVLDAGSSGILGWCLAAFAEGKATADGSTLIVLARAAGEDWKVRVCSLNSGDPEAPLA